MRTENINIMKMSFVIEKLPIEKIISGMFGIKNLRTTIIETNEGMANGMAD